MLDDLQDHLRAAVSHFWFTRMTQAERQRALGRTDQGTRSAVTGGAQMDGFVELVSDLVASEGLDRSHVYCKKALELPGFFRPTKMWDLLVVRDGQLVIALEAKSHVGPSFGNNFNNRTEEAMGSALDLWTAYREGAFNRTVRPWLGYFIMLEDCDKTRCPVSVREPHFEVFPEFKGSSYAKRYELFCRKLVRERHYNAAAFLISSNEEGAKGLWQEPADDLTFENFARSLCAQVSIYAKSEGK